MTKLKTYAMIRKLDGPVAPCFVFADRTYIFLNSCVSEFETE